MHQSDNHPSNAPARAPSTWMLAVLAFSLAPPLCGLLFSSQLAQANTWLVAALGVDARGDIHLLRLLLRVALPTLLMLAVLRLSPLGRWIVMTRLALGLFMIESALYLLHVLDQVSLFVLDGGRVLPGLLKGPAEPVAFTCLILAIALLVWATAWHRSALLRRWLASLQRMLLRPV